MTQRTRLPSSSARKNRLNTPKTSQTTALTKNKIRVHFKEVENLFLSIGISIYRLATCLPATYYILFPFQSQSICGKTNHARVDFSETWGVVDHGQIPSIHAKVMVLDLLVIHPRRNLGQGRVFPPPPSLPQLHLKLEMHNIGRALSKCGIRLPGLTDT